MRLISFKNLIFQFRRFIVLTNKNIFAFTNDDKDSDCTMTLILKACNKIQTSDDEAKKENSFVKFYFK